jgi:hypothetical protein
MGRKVAYQESCPAIPPSLRHRASAVNPVIQMERARPACCRRFCPTLPLKVARVTPCAPLLRAASRQSVAPAFHIWNCRKKQETKRVSLKELGCFAC